MRHTVMVGTQRCQTSPADTHTIRLNRPIGLPASGTRARAWLATFALDLSVPVIEMRSPVGSWLRP
jgi:hypothetical protein